MFGPVGAAVHRWDTTSFDVTPWLRLVLAPGHTPGCVVGMLTSAGETALLAGDIFHSPFELVRTDLNLLVDADGDAAATQRRKWADLARRTHAKVFAPHFPSLAPVQL